MQPPADLSEGWWWVRWKVGRTSIERVYRDRGRWMVGLLVETELEREAFIITAMERVAPPSWEAGR